MRFRLMRSFIATLAFSQGVPMLSHGDEFARTQRGNLIYAEIVARKALVQDPDSLPASNLLGLVAARAGLIGPAEKIFRRAHAAWPGEHLLIVTLGTATTVEALRADGDYLGGLIAPGPALMLQSLAQGTAQLPTLDATTPTGGQAFARSTSDAILRGCAAAQAGLDVAEYAPNHIKKCVVGVGHAGKEQVMMMVKRLLPTAGVDAFDAADALAAAIAHAHLAGTRAKIMAALA